MANRNELIIWDIDVYDSPNDFDHAVEMAHILSEQSADNISLNLKKFARKLSKIAQKAKQDDDIWEGYQNIEQEIATLSYAAFILEMPNRGWESILKEAVALASKLNLAIFYEEAIIAFLPNDQILPPENLPYWQATKKSLKARTKSTFPKKLEQFKVLMEPKFDLLLAKYGFVDGLEMPEPEGIYSAYSRKLGDIDQYINFNYRLEHGRDSFTFITTAGVSHQSINTIFEHFSLRLSKPLSFRISINCYDMPREAAFIKNNESAEEFIAYLTKNLLPILNQLNSIVEVDTFIQSDNPYASKIRSKYFYAPLRIITARLANNPQYDELVTELETVISWGINDPVRHEVWPKLLKYLQDEVQPLDNKD